MIYLFFLIFQHFKKNASSKVFLPREILENDVVIIEMWKWHMQMNDQNFFEVSRIHLNINFF